MIRPSTLTIDTENNLHYFFQETLNGIFGISYIRNNNSAWSWTYPVHLNDNYSNCLSSCMIGKLDSEFDGVVVAWCQYNDVEEVYEVVFLTTWQLIGEGGHPVFSTPLIYPLTGISISNINSISISNETIYDHAIHCALAYEGDGEYKVLHFKVHYNQALSNPEIIDSGDTVTNITVMDAVFPVSKGVATIFPVINDIHIGKPYAGAVISGVVDSFNMYLSQDLSFRKVHQVVADVSDQQNPPEKTALAYSVDGYIHYFYSFTAAENATIMYRKAIRTGDEEEFISFYNRQPVLTYGSGSESHVLGMKALVDSENVVHILASTIQTTPTPYYAIKHLKYAGETFSIVNAFESEDYIIGDFDIDTTGKVHYFFGCKGNAKLNNENNYTEGQYCTYYENTLSSWRLVYGIYGDVTPYAIRVNNQTGMVHFAFSVSSLGGLCYENLLGNTLSNVEFIISTMYKFGNMEVDKDDAVYISLLGREDA
jgi:hypothetical protein